MHYITRTSGGVLATNQQCYYNVLEPQEDRLKDSVNLVSVVLTTEVVKRVEEHVSGCFYKNFLTTSDCRQRMDPLDNFLT